MVQWQGTIPLLPIARVQALLHVHFHKLSREKRKRWKGQNWEITIAKELKILKQSLALYISNWQSFSFWGMINVPNLT